MKIALIRGSNFNYGELQSFLPLIEEHSLTGFADSSAGFSMNSANLQIERLFSPAGLVNKAPFWLRRLVRHGLSFTLGGAGNWLPGLEHKLQGMDILHTAETANGYSYQALRTKRKWGGALVVTCWETIPFNFQSHSITLRMKAAVRSEADHFIAITERARSCLLEEGVEPSRISVIPAGIDLEHFSPGKPSSALREEIGLDPKLPTILFVGRLVPEKGVHDILQAIAFLRKEYGTRVNLLMVGEGREQNRIIRNARQLGLEDTLFLAGAVPYEKIVEFYRLADISVLPSKPTRKWEEQFGMTLVEAMACGVPVVASRSGAIPEVVAEAGFLVLPYYPQELAEAIALLLRNNVLREVLSQRGRRRATKRYSHLDISRRIAEIYKKVAEKCNSQSHTAK